MRTCRTQRWSTRALLVAAAILITVPTTGVQAQRTSAVASPRPVTLYVFHRKSCENCSPALEFLKLIAKEDHWLKIKALDLDASEEARKLLDTVLDVFGLENQFQPVLVAGSHVVFGYDTNDTTGMEILGFATYCHWFGCKDLITFLQEQEPWVMAKIRRDASPHSDVGCVAGSVMRCRVARW